MDERVDAFLQNAERWREEFAQLREIALGCSLTEELKWGKPCYSIDGNNVVLIHGFKTYCALLLMKGALLDNRAGLLVQQTPNVQAARQLRFTSAREIREQQPTIAAYIRAAIELERAGATVAYKPTDAFAVPEEFRDALAGSAQLATAFEALTPGRQRGYLLYFSGAKQPKTRTARIEKSVPRILAGQGLDD